MLTIQDLNFILNLLSSDAIRVNGRQARDLAAVQDKIIATLQHAQEQDKQKSEDVDGDSAGPT